MVVKLEEMISLIFKSLHVGTLKSTFHREPKKQFAPLGQ